MSASRICSVAAHVAKLNVIISRGINPGKKNHDDSRTARRRRRRRRLHRHRSRRGSARRGAVPEFPLFSKKLKIRAKIYSNLLTSTRPSATTKSSKQKLIGYSINWRSVCVMRHLSYIDAQPRGGNRQTAKRFCIHSTTQQFYAPVVEHF